MSVEWWNGGTQSTRRKNKREFCAYLYAVFLETLCLYRARESQQFRLINGPVNRAGTAKNGK